MFQNLCSNLGKLEIYLFAPRVLKHLKKIHILENRPIQHVEGCISNKLVPRFELRFSPIHFNSQSSGKSPKGESILDLVESCLANHKIASKVARNEHSKPDYSSKLPRFIKESKKGGSSTVTKPVFKIRCMKSFREKLSWERISGRASNLISKAKRIGTNSNYKSAWRKFDSSCRERQVDPIRCDKFYYLIFMFHYLIQIQIVIETHRSYIWTFHEQIDRISVGNHPRVCALMSGVFNQRFYSGWLYLRQDANLKINDTLCIDSCV